MLPFCDNKTVFNVFGVFYLFPGVLSEEKRQEVMHRSAWQYSAATWANKGMETNIRIAANLLILLNIYLLRRIVIRV